MYIIWDGASASKTIVKSCVLAIFFLLLFNGIRRGRSKDADRTVERCQYKDGDVRERLLRCAGSVVGDSGTLIIIVINAPCTAVEIENDQKYATSCVLYM